ncbi:hypothetical protein J7J62_07825 [bacterium]|nr:hypothetical protein [bacterium]
MKKYIITSILLLIFLANILFAAQTQKSFSTVIASVTRTFKANWNYNCPAELEIHFKLYIKDGDQWILIKQMDSYCTQEDQETKHFEELFEYEIPALGKDYIFGMTAVNREGTESDIVQCTVHIPLPKPEAVQNFKVEVQQ